MAAIDLHTHAFPDAIAARAMAKLQEGVEWSACGDGTIAGLIRSMDAADVDISVICTIATKPDQADGILKWCKQIRGDRIHPFPSVHPDTPKPAKWIQRFAKQEYGGIKLHPMYQDFAADEPRMDPIYAACSDHGLAIAIHSGRDIAFPPEDDRAHPRRMRNVLDRFPDLKLICGHMGGWQNWDEVEQYLVGTHALLETSFSLQHMTPEQARRIIANHGADKVFFGTDWPWNDQAQELERIQSLHLEPGDSRKILYRNAAYLLGY